MELALPTTLFPIQLDCSTPENHNCCSAPTKTVLTHRSKHGEFTSIIMVEGLAIKTLSLWCLNVPDPPDLGSPPVIVALLRTSWGQI